MTAARPRVPRSRGVRCRRGARGREALRPLASDSSSRHNDNPVVDGMSLSLQDVGHWVIAVTLNLPGPEGVDGSATLLWHVQVLERATPAP